MQVLCCLSLILLPGVVTLHDAILSHSHTLTLSLQPDGEELACVREYLTLLNPHWKEGSELSKDSTETSSKIREASRCTNAAKNSNDLLSHVTIEQLRSLQQLTQAETTDKQTVSLLTPGFLLVGSVLSPSPLLCALNYFRIFVFPYFFFQLASLISEKVLELGYLNHVQDIRENCVSIRVIVPLRDTSSRSLMAGHVNMRKTYAKRQGRGESENEIVLL